MAKRKFKAIQPSAFYGTSSDPRKRSKLDKSISKMEYVAATGQLAHTIARVAKAVKNTREALTQTQIQEIADMPNKLYIKRLKFNYTKAPNVKGASDSIHLHYTKTGVADCGSGDQLVNPQATSAENVVLIPNMFTRGQILGTSSVFGSERPLLVRGPGNEQFSLFQANQSMVPPPLDTGVETYLSTQVPHPEQYVLVRNVDETILLKNNGSFPCTVQLYWFIAKEQTTKSPFELMTEEMTDNIRGQVAATVTETNYTTGYVNSPQYMPNYGPGNLKQWRSDWRICHAESFVLEMNEQVKFVIHHRVNRVLSKENVENNPGFAIPNLTMYPMIFANGSLGTIKEDNGHCTVSPVKMISMVTRHYEIAFLPKKVIAPPFQAFNLQHGRGVVVQEVDTDTNTVVDYIAS